MQSRLAIAFAGNGVEIAIVRIKGEAAGESRAQGKQRANLRPGRACRKGDTVKRRYTRGIIGDGIKIIILAVKRQAAGKLEAQHELSIGGAVRIQAEERRGAQVVLGNRVEGSAPCILSQAPRKLRAELEQRVDFPGAQFDAVKVRDTIVLWVLVIGLGRVAIADGED